VAIAAAAAFSLPYDPLGLRAKAILIGVGIYKGETVLAQESFFFSARDAIFREKKIGKKAYSWGKLLFLFVLQFVIIRVV